MCRGLKLDVYSAASPFKSAERPNTLAILCGRERGQKFVRGIISGRLHIVSCDIQIDKKSVLGSCNQVSRGQKFRVKSESTFTSCFHPSHKNSRALRKCLLNPQSLGPRLPQELHSRDGVTISDTLNRVAGHWSLGPRIRHAAGSFPR